MSRSDLKPCKACGAEEQDFVAKDGLDWVECRKCGAKSKPNRYLIDSIDDWNSPVIERRAPVEITDEMVERALAAHRKATEPRVYENAAAMRAALDAALNPP